MGTSTGPTPRRTPEEHYEQRLRNELKGQGADKRTIERHVETFTLLLQPCLGKNTPEVAYRVTLEDFESCVEMRRHRRKHPLPASAN